MKFNVEEEVFIVKKYSEGLTDIEVKRAYRLKFGQSWALINTPPHHFHRVYEQFKKRGKLFTASLKKP